AYGLDAGLDADAVVDQIDVVRLAHRAGQRVGEIRFPVDLRFEVGNLAEHAAHQDNVVLVVVDQQDADGFSHVAAPLWPAPASQRWPRLRTMPTISVNDEGFTM